MNFKLFSLVTGMSVLAACGMDYANSQSNRAVSQDSALSDNGPDFKTEDGIEILTWVKNKAVQKELCASVREQKALGHKPHDPQTSSAVARKFRLHTAEAEIVILYAVEFGCPELS
ncbi:MAG: hypothetical protein RJB13_1990 [Pseudomonadota bacterium]|jgi:hypothetical protein